MKAYVLRINTKESWSAAARAAASCIKHNIPFEYHKGWQRSNYDIPKQKMYRNPDLNEIGKELDYHPQGQFKSKNHLAMLATFGHYEIWKKIYDSGEVGIVLEHDSVILRNPPKEIPNGIINLGYKSTTPISEITTNNNTIIFVPRRRHYGAHAYMITPETAKFLSDDRKLRDCVDSVWFSRFEPSELYNKVPLYITDPVVTYTDCSYSEIDNESVGDIENYNPIKSFINSNKFIKGRENEYKYHEGLL